MSSSLVEPLRNYFRNRPDVYVAANVPLYYDEEAPQAVITPDLFVVTGVPRKERRNYKLWEEAKSPDVVIELASEEIRQKELTEKRLLYEMLGVREYFIYDPWHTDLMPSLRGFRLEDNNYAPLRPTPLPEGEWAAPSEMLGLTLQTIPGALRFCDPATGKLLPTYAEQADRRRRAEARLAEVEAELARWQALAEEAEE